MSPSSCNLPPRQVRRWRRSRGATSTSCRAPPTAWWSWNYFGFNEFDPEGDRFYRHVRDWLRMETDDGAPHWVHSLCRTGCTSDQDDRGPAYESDDDDGYDRIANDATSMRSCAALTTKMPRLSRSRVTSSPFPLLARTQER